MKVSLLAAELGLLVLIGIIKEGHECWGCFLRVMDSAGLLLGVLNKVVIVVISGIGVGVKTSVEAGESAGLETIEDSVTERQLNFPEPYTSLKFTCDFVSHAEVICWTYFGF